MSTRLGWIDLLFWEAVRVRARWYCEHLDLSAGMEKLPGESDDMQRLTLIIHV